jgi:hypothetical protein
VRRLWASAVALVVLAVGAGCGQGGEEGRSSSRSSAIKPVGEESAGSVVQFADCGDWRGGSRAQRRVTIERLRGQLTPQRSTTAASPLSDARAYELFQRACAPSYAESLRLYKLYVRMQGFAPLSQ